MKLRYNKQRDAQGLLLQDREVMKLLLKAKSRNEICRELGLPLGTVNTSCSRIYQNAGVHSLPELLVKYATEATMEDPA